MLKILAIAAFMAGISTMLTGCTGGYSNVDIHGSGSVGAAAAEATDQAINRGPTCTRGLPNCREQYNSQRTVAGGERIVQSGNGAGYVSGFNTRDFSSTYRRQWGTTNSPDYYYSSPRY
jgi:uncharacterized protein YraI